MNKNLYLILLFLIYLFYLFLLFLLFLLIKFSTSVKFSQIYIVYFIYIDTVKNWREILEGQMNDIKKTNILKNNKLFVVISCNNLNYTENAKDIVNNIFAENINNISFTVETKNLYEYPGIKKIYELACLNKDKLFIYFHSKGMTFHDSNGRLTAEKLLTRYTFNNWENTLNMFNNDNSIKKAGLIPGFGFIWYNFWWATGEYISSLEEPIITDNRYYYEIWLADSKILDKNKYLIDEEYKSTLDPLKNDSYSLIHKKKIYYTLNQAVVELDKLNMIEFYSGDYFK